MLCNFFESFEDIYRSSAKSDNSCEVHISDSEEVSPRFPKKSPLIKKTGNANIHPKTSPCDYSVAVKEWNFYKAEAAELLQSSRKLKKFSVREKRRSIKSVQSFSTNSEDCSKEENLPKENRVSLNMSNIPESELCEPFVGKSMLHEIQDVNILPQSVNICTKKYLPIKKPPKFSADSDLLSSMQMTPRVKKVKPQLLKDVSSGAFINRDMDFKAHQAKFPGVLKNARTSDSFIHVQTLTTPKVKKTVLPLMPSDKRNAGELTSENFEDMCPQIHKEANSFDCSFFGDQGMTSKVKKVKVEDFLSDEERVFSDASLHFAASQVECPEISESSGSLVKDSISQSAVNEDYDISDYSDNPASLDMKTGQEKHGSRENFENINHCAEGGVDFENLSHPQNTVSSIHKGSDFVKSIKLHQESVSKPKKELEVHSEKRKKYLPGGFAEQAQKLEQREKSSVVLWSHQKSSEAGIGLRRYLSLKIHLFSIVSSFVITKCEILKDSSISVEQKDKKQSVANYVFRRSGIKGEVTPEHFSKENSSKESFSDFRDCVYSNILERSTEKFKDCIVAIKSETWHKLKLTTDAVIRIFPPWQTLWINSLNIHVLLCTYFMEVLSVPTSVSSVEKSPFEKVLYSSTPVCTNAAVQDVEKKPGVSLSHSISGYKQPSSSNIFPKLDEKEKVEKSFLSGNKTMFPKKITRNTKVGELVVVTGKIVKVNKENSVLWLECDHCQNRNLLEDEQGVKYCEACSKSVSKPVRKLKMEVALQVPSMPDTVLVVQLFCPTVDKIFPFTKEGQPLYEVSDILDTSVGPVVCSVLSYSITGNKITYHLQEVS